MQELFLVALRRSIAQYFEHSVRVQVIEFLEQVTRNLLELSGLLNGKF